MITKKQIDSVKNKRLGGIWTTAGFLLLIPLIATQLSGAVTWDGFDFFIAAVLLFGTGFTIELVLPKVKDKDSKMVVIAAVLMLLFLIWAELSVGIFGSAFAGS